MGVVEVAMAGCPKGDGGGAESAIVKVGVELGKLRVEGEEVFIWVEANVPIGDHKAFESLGDVVLVGAAARVPVGETTASEGDDPCPHVMPYGCKAPIISSIVVRRGGVERIEVDVREYAMSAEAERQGGEVEGVDVGECVTRWAVRGEEGFEASLGDKAIECSKGGVS